MREQDLLRGLGQHIAALRKAADLSQEELGNKVGVTWKTIGNIERGVTFTSLATLYKLSQALGCRLSDLFTWAPASKARSADDALDTAITRLRELPADQPVTLEIAIELLTTLAKRKVRSPGGKARKTLGTSP